MSWLDDIGSDLSSGWNSFIGMTPNAAGDARTAMEPAIAPMRAPNGRLDPNAIKAVLPSDVSSDLGPDIDTATALGNLRAQAIGQYQAPQRSGLQWLGDIMKAASVPISAYQGNNGYADQMQGQLSKEADLRNSFASERAKMGLENVDNTLTGVGSTASNYLTKKRDMRLQLRQSAAQMLARAAAVASVNGQDPHEAQAQVIPMLASQMRAMGFGDDAAQFEKAYAPQSTSPTPTAGLVPNQNTGQPASSPSSPMSGGGGLPPAAGNTPLPVPAPGQQPGPTLVAAANSSAPPASPPIAASVPQPAPAQPDMMATVNRLRQQADQFRMMGLDDQAKAYEERAKDMLGKLQFKTMKDQDGNETGVYVDESNPASTPVSFAPGMERSASLDAAIKQGVKGQDFAKLLEQSNPIQAAYVKKMLNGDVAPPANVSTRNPMTMRNIAYASQIEPGFDATRWGARNAAMKSFYGGGDDAKSVKSLNQTMHHIASLVPSADAMGNGNYPAWNYLTNAVSAGTGSGKPLAFVTKAGAVADEMGKVFKGANLSDTEIKKWEESLSPNMSPEQQRAAISSLMSLAHGAMDALDQKRINALGPNMVAQKGPLMGPREQELQKRVEAWGQGKPFVPLPEIPEAAKTELIKRYTKEDPDLFQQRRAQFDKHFGPGASDEILGDYSQ